MGNCVSRCSNSRGKLLPCSRKRFNEDEPMLSSTYESEAPSAHDPHKNNYQGPCRYPSEILIDRAGDDTDGNKSNPGVIEGHDLLDANSLTNRSQRSQSRSPALQSRKSSATTTPSTTPKSGRFKFNWKGYRALKSNSGRKKQRNDSQNSTKQELDQLSSVDKDEDKERKLVDTSCQTVIHGDALKNVSSLPVVSSTPEPSGGLTKEYIVRTYSIQNATPSPSTNPKFSPSNPILPSTAARTSSSSSSSSSKATDLNNSLVVPSTPPAIVEETIIPEVNDGQVFCRSPRSSAIGDGQYNSVSSSLRQHSSHSLQPTGSGPLACLEHRQLEVVGKLEKLKDSVSSLAQKYNVTTSTSTTSASSSSSSSTLAITGPAVCTPKDLGNCVKDMVISADPSSIPLSLIMLGQQLESQYTVYKQTFVHSSVRGQVPENLTQMMLSNGGRSRASCQLALTLVWKKLSNGPQLVVDPTKQTPIQGEANVVRYLARLLQPAYDDTTDIVSATQIDDFLDLAQMQILEGNAKEKAAALRSLNSSLGKKDWLLGNGPTIADFVCWSALHQTGQASAPPANVKKWLSACSNHDSFKTALSLVDVSS